MDEQAPTQTDMRKLVLLYEKIGQIQGHYISLFFLFWFFSCSLCSVNLRVKAKKLFLLLSVWQTQQVHLPPPFAPFAGKRFLMTASELLLSFSVLTCFILIVLVLHLMYRVLCNAPIVEQLNMVYGGVLRTILKKMETRTLMRRMKEIMAIWRRSNGFPVWLPVPAPAPGPAQNISLPPEQIVYHVPSLNLTNQNTPQAANTDPVDHSWSLSIQSNPTPIEPTVANDQAQKRFETIQFLPDDMGPFRAPRN